jgi:hypothetical protein
MWRNNAQNTMPYFHGKACDIYHTTDSDVRLTTIQTEVSFALPWQIWLNEHATMLHYTYIA